VQPAGRYDYWVDDTLTIPLPIIDGRPVMPFRGPQLPPRETPGPETRNPVARVFSALRDPAYRSSYALVANTIGTNLIGAAYWVVVARLYGPEKMGQATALISALMLVAIIAQLNLGSMMMRFLPQMGAISAGRLIKFSYLVTSLTALAGSVIFVTVLPRLSSEWHFVGGSAFLAVLFAVSVVVWEIFTLQDAAVVGLQHPVVVPVENVIYALAKLALLVVAAELLGSKDILFSWMTPLILLIPVVNWLIFRYLRERSPQDMVPGLRVRRLARFASVDYLGMICGQVTGNVLPLLVISVLGPAASGSFYIASLITSGVAGLGVSFSTGLLVEAAAAPDRLAELTRGALKRCVLLMGPATLVMVFGAPLILRVYGGSYAAHTVRLFQLLALTLLPFCISTIAFSLDRIAGKPIRATLTQLANSVFLLGGCWLLFGRLGLNGVGVAALVTDTAIALVRLPTVLGALRRRPGATAWPAGAPRQAAVPGFPASAASARPDRTSDRQGYAGRHRATTPRGNSSTDRQQGPTVGRQPQGPPPGQPPQALPPRWQPQGPPPARPQQGPATARPPQALPPRWQPQGPPPARPPQGPPPARPQGPPPGRQPQGPATGRQPQGPPPARPPQGPPADRQPQGPPRRPVNGREVHSSQRAQGNGENPRRDGA
jgi:O-antigen/teichoic acid export membrane protein